MDQDIMSLSKKLFKTTDTDFTKFEYEVINKVRTEESLLLLVILNMKCNHVMHPKWNFDMLANTGLCVFSKYA